MSQKRIREAASGLSAEVLRRKTAAAVRHFWSVRSNQAARQASGDRKDQGARGAVTGGAQMDGFIAMVTKLLEGSGVARDHIFHRQALELPGFFRPTKEWDLLVVRDGQLLVAMEAKSQVGPSFGNNFNNRTEEAMGSALDLWTAFREGAFNRTIQPWLGYLFLLEDCDASKRSVRVKEPHFPVFSEFRNASYASRYEHFCRKLVRERHYSASALLLSSQGQGTRRAFTEPAEDLTVLQLVKSLLAHVSAYG